MEEWQVMTPNGPVVVKAHKATTTPAGVLTLTENSGQLVRAFAPGAWFECELLARAGNGYGGGL